MSFGKGPAVQVVDRENNCVRIAYGHEDIDPTTLQSGVSEHYPDCPSRLVKNYDRRPPQMMRSRRR